MPSANAKWYKLGDALLVLSVGDLTTWSGDAIVNAANERMLGGGGVDGAIHRAAGPKLREACLQVPEVAPDVRCPTGEARITRGGRLQAKYVIHTVGPVYKSAEESAPVLAKAYRSCMELANKHRLENISFPAISTGVYGYPHNEAAQVALQAVTEAVGSIKYIEFVLYPEQVWDAFVVAADAVLEAIPGATAAVSEPRQEPEDGGPAKTASLHPSSQAAQPTASGSGSDSVCGGAGNKGAADNEVTSAAAARAPTPSVNASGAPSSGTAPAPAAGAPSGATGATAPAPSGTAATESGGPRPSTRS